MDYAAAEASAMLNAEEDANQSLCEAAATLAGVSPERAENCDSCECRCQYCPWRNPKELPQVGDQLRLASGRLIEVHFLNFGDTRGPRIQYRIVHWHKHYGGRAEYQTRLEAWPKLVLGAEVVRVGNKPSKRFPDYEKKLSVFNRAQRDHVRGNQP